MKVPQFAEIKCDYIKCYEIATVYYDEISLDSVMIRDLKVCQTHSMKLMEREKYGGHDIPYVEYVPIYKKAVKCLRCSNVWTPKSFNSTVQHMDGKFMKMPCECPACGTKLYKVNSIGSHAK